MMKTRIRAKHGHRGGESIPLIVALALLTTPAFSALVPTPSSAPVRNVTNNYFGVDVADPYRWMEDWKSPEFQAWLKAENEFARTRLDGLPARKELLSELRRLDSSLNTFPSALNPVGERLFYMQSPPPADVFQLFMRDKRDGRERLIFDPQKLSYPEGSHHSLDLYHAAPDGKHVVCRVSRGGSEETTLYVVATSNGQLVGQPIEHAESGNSSWHPDGRAFFYKRPPLPDEPRAATTQAPKRRVYLHYLNADTKNDRPVFGFGVTTNVPLTERQSVSVQTSWDSEYIVGVVREGVGRHSEVYVTPVSSLDKREIPWRKVCGFDDEVFDCTLQKDALLLSSHREAPRGKLLRVSCKNPNMARAELLLPEHNAVLGQVAVARDGIYVVRGDGITPHLIRISHDGNAREIALPVVGTIDRIIRDPREPGVILPMASWNEATAYYALDPKTLTFSKLTMGLTETPGLVPLQGERADVRSKDGTLVPLTIVFRKGLSKDGRRPTLVIGYGAYGMSQTPSFDLSRNPWFAAGGVYAVAHVRGGGELGEEWRRAGKGPKKQNGIDDFIACADYLVAQGYTAPAKLAAKGTSAGGVVVGRALTQKPELFRAAILEVACLDALHFENTRNGPPNVPEWGSVKTEEGFAALRAMSPYEHVVPGTAYPAVLLTAGMNDPRVDVWQPAKMAARLRAASTSGRPILLAVNYDEGHFHTTLSSFNEHHADTWAFLLWQLGEIGGR